MQVLNIPALREMIENQAALAFGLGILTSAAYSILRRPRRHRGNMRSSLRADTSLTFSSYRDALSRREQQIRDAMVGAAGDRLTLLNAELTAVNDRLSNLADWFFVMKSELAQAGASLMLMQKYASESEIIGARTALNSGDARPAELIFERAANSGSRIAQTVEAHYQLGRLALADINYARAVHHLRQASEITPDDLRVNASLAELVDVVVTLVEAEPLPSAVLRVLEEVLLAQGRAAVAEQLYQRAVVFYERTLGPDHPRTVRSLKSLARLYCRQQKHEEAEPLYQRMLAIAEVSAGHNGPEVAAILEKLASVYDGQGRHECVWRSLSRVLMIREAALGSNHPDVIEVVSRLAKTSRDVGHLSEAKLLYRRLLGVMERTFGPEHTNAAIILKELAEICDLLEDYQEAETFYRRTLSIRERAARADDPFCIDILRGLAEVYRKQGKHRLAEPLRRRVLAHSERALGLEHSEGTRTRESREHSGEAKCKYRRAQCTGG